MKTKNTFYNSIASLFYYFSTIILGVLNRKAVILFLGIEYQGINGLFSNILSMLSIAELGVGTAIIFHLYGPMSKNDKFQIKALMNFYRRCYWIIAGVILSLGLLIMPLLPLIVTDNSTSYSLPILYIWFLLDSVVSYLFTYKRSILIADQKNYVIIACDFCYQLIVKLGQIVILWLLQDFIIYLSLMVIFRLLENLLINFISNRKYPYLSSNDDVYLLPQNIVEDIKKKVKGTVFHKIGSFIVLGTDNILISRFLGLAAVGIYSNYYLIINTIKSVCSQILISATASVGHLLAEKNENRIYQVFTEMQIMNGLLINCASIGIYCVATPIISFIFGNEYILSDDTLFVLSINFYIQGMRTVYNIFKETSGILYEDRFVPVIESVINIVASIFLLKILGLAGVFLGTILSSLILYVYTYPVLVYRRVLRQSIRKYYLELLWGFFATVISMIIVKKTCVFFKLNNPILQILFNSASTMLLGNSIYFVLFMSWKNERKSLYKRIKKTIRN